MKAIASLLACLILLSGCGYKFKTYYDLQNKATVPINKDIKVAVVLGGGGARAIADLGVLEVLEEHGITVDLIVGTSGGSIIGALYADNPDARALKTIAEKLRINDFVDFSLLGAIHGTHDLASSYVNGRNGEKFLEKHMRSREFKDLKIPFIAVATDIVTGETISLNNGPIAPAVRASYSIPGLFAPVEIYGRTLVDGGVSAPLAVQVARLYDPKIIIAVDLSLPVEKSNVYNVVDIVTKALAINYNALSDMLGKEADILIKPQMRNIGIFDAHRKDELYNAGRKAAEEKIGDIKKQLYKKTTLLDRLLKKKKV
jgi:NTE family protein